LIKKSKKGLVFVFTGEGKGKTTSALGMALRASGHRKKILVIQFLKNYENYGELKFAKRFPKSNIRIKTFGEGYVGIRGDKKPRELHIEAAKKALAFAEKMMKSRRYFMIILDEVNIALNLKLLKAADVLKILKSKPKNLHLVLTGRGAPKKIIQAADLVTEMKEVKHPFRKGILAQEGIEF